MNAATNHIRDAAFRFGKDKFFPIRCNSIPRISRLIIHHSAFYILTAFLTTLTPRSKLIFTRYVPEG